MSKEIDDLGFTQHPDPVENLSWGTLNPTTVIDCAGAMLTQQIMNAILAKLQNGSQRFQPPIIDIRIRNVSIKRVPEVEVKWDDQQENER